MNELREYAETQRAVSRDSQETSSSRWYWLVDPRARTFSS
jgi:hypothetical protein